MPSRKRVLAEADLNASVPSSKRAAGGKENAMSSYSSKTVAELTVLLKERGLPLKGKKADLVERLRSVDSVAPPQDASPEATSGETNADASWNDEIEFVTTCRPESDMIAERYEIEEDFDPDEVEELGTCGTEACVCGKSPQDHPECKWLVSRKGFEMIQHLRLEAMHRDQDYMGEYHYNDFTGYGFQEVVNNHLQSFHTEYMKKEKDVGVLWAHVEGIANCIPGPGHWFMSDDSVQILDSLELLGYSILATLEVLKDQGLLREDGEIKNIPLVLSQYIEMVEEWPGEEEEDEEKLGWRFALIQMADQNGIKITGPFGIEKKVEALRDEGVEDIKKWRKFEGKKKFDKFVRDYSMDGKKLGGTHYDLSKQKKSKRKTARGRGFM